MGKKYCDVCGKELVEQNGVCANCGAEINGAVVIDEATSVAPTVATVTDTNKTPKKRLIINIIAVLFLVSAVAFSFIFGLGRDVNTSAKDKKVVTSSKEEIEKTTEEATEEATTAPTTQKPVDYNQIYDVLVQRYRKIINDPPQLGNELEGETLTVMSAVLSGTDRAKQNVGYTIKDISGDGIPEFIVGGREEKMVYAVYTCVNGTPQLSFYSGPRDGYCLMTDGHFYNSGSSAATQSCVGEYVINSNGMGLTCINNYFTYELDDTMTEIGYYHNTTGMCDPANAEASSSDAFGNAHSDYESRMTEFALNSF